MQSYRLDQILLRMGLVDEAQLRRALERQRQRGGRLGTHLVETRAVTPEQLVMALSEQSGMPSVVPTEDSIDRTLLEQLPPGFVTEYAVLPLQIDAERGSLSLAVADPADPTGVELACAMLGATSAFPMIASESIILELGARLSTQPRRPIELPELFDAASSGLIAAIGADPVEKTDLGDVLMVSGGAAIRNFLPAVFIREGWRLHVVENREEFDEAIRARRFEHVLVDQAMAETLVKWMKETDGAGLGSRISVFPSVSSSLMDNPAPYSRTMRSIKHAVRMFADLRCRQSGLTVPYGLIAKDVELLARRCGLREIAVDGLGTALHYLLPGDPFADFDASLDAARQLRFPWRIETVLQECADRYERGPVGDDPGHGVGELGLAAQILALCWYRHMVLHLPDSSVEQIQAGLRAGLRAQSGRLAGVEVVESYIRQVDESGRRPAGDGEHQILIVGESSAEVGQLVDRLRRIGYQPIQATDPADAQAMIARRPPAAILFDHDCFESEAENFCRVHGLNTVSLLYFVTGNNDPVATLSLLDAGADDVFAPPHDFDLSVARIDRALRARIGQLDASTTVPGQIVATLGAFSFPELLQSLGHGLKSVCIQLTRGSGESAVVYLQEGRLVHAACAEVTGEDAVYRVLAWRDDGEFVVVPETDFPPANVELPLHNVLMEGCRILDEMVT